MGESEGECLDHGTCLESLLTCDGESEELEETDEELEDLGYAGGDAGGLEELVDLYRCRSLLRSWRKPTPILGLGGLAKTWRFLGSWSQQTKALRDISALWN